MRVPVIIATLSLLGSVLVGCADDGDVDDTGGDARESSFLAGGKTDAFGFGETSPQAVAVLLIVNAAPYEVLADEAGIDPRAVEGVIAHRNGPDGLYDTPDDDIFDSLQELDDIDWFGPEVFAALVRYAEREGLLEPSIIGGTGEEGYPATGYVQRNGRMLCTMVLVRPDVVLTAAHCVEEPAIYSIGFGKYSIFNEAWIAKEVYVHPQYTNRPYRHDVAVITLERPVTHVQPAVMGTVGTGCGYRGVGYGRSDEGLRTDAFSSWEWAQRKSVQLCVERLSDEKVFVDGVNGAICWGDSGGPLFVEGTNTVVATLFGSTVARCQEDKIDIYMNLAVERWFVDAAIAGRCRREGYIGTPSICDGSPSASTAWVGTACADASTCDFSHDGGDAFCLEIPAADTGFCTVGCQGYCPDKAGEASTFCVSPGQGVGYCASKAAPENDQCADIPGTVPTEAERYIGDSGASQATAVVCLPAP